MPFFVSCLQILYCKLSVAMKVLMDALKFKYPRVYEAVSKVARTVQREGVSELLGRLWRQKDGQF